MSNYKKEEKTKVSTLSVEAIEILEAYEYKMQHGIKSIEDCQNASEELLCGFLSDVPFTVDASTHLEDSERLASIIEAHDEAVFYGFRTSTGKSMLMRTDKYISAITNQ